MRAGRGVVTEGWVTLEVPAGTSSLEDTESRLVDDSLTWVVAGSVG